MKNIEELMAKEKNTPLRELTRIAFTQSSATAFERLISLRDEVDKEVYCAFVRYLTQLNTQDVPVETMMTAYAGLSKEDLMYEEELEFFEKLPPCIKIYRGCPADEYPPRLSWSLEQKVARKFSMGQMYEAKIRKNDIIALYTYNTDEFEVIANVPEGLFDDIL